MDARFNEIQEQMLQAKNEASDLSALEILTTNEQTLNDVDATSKVSIWRLFIWIFSFAIWLHEKIVEKNAANSRPQNLPNYRQMVLNYLDGLPLIFSNGQFVFDTAGVTDLDERNIIKRCAVLENNRGIVVKIATENAGVLEPVTNIQAERILNYINQQTQPGVAVRLVNEEADSLKVNLTVYVDPNVIDLATGKQLNVSGDVYPVKDAINSYLANLEFNGGFVRNYFSNTIEAATGVKVVTIDLLQWKYASLPFADLGIYKIPNAGHFKIDEADLTINYLSDAVLG